MSERSRQIAALNIRYLACPSCDALFERPTLAPGQRARCPRCHEVIATNKHRGAERTSALMLASLIVYAVAVMFPFMSMERSGLSNRISVVDAVAVLWSNGMTLLAVVSGLLILVIPAIRIGLVLVLNASLARRETAQRKQAFLLRMAQHLEPWAMADIFMIGVIVSLVKIGSLARIEVGPAFWAMSALIVFMAMAATAACRDSAWQRVRPWS
ncbi:MAG: paraquat-inducible protein A [Pseudomonadota bacterium]